MSGVKFKLDEQKLLPSCKQRNKGSNSEMMLRQGCYIVIKGPTSIRNIGTFKHSIIKAVPEA
jgi:hypothetical protein